MNGKCHQITEQKEREREKRRRKKINESNEANNIKRNFENHTTDWSIEPISYQFYWIFCCYCCCSFSFISIQCFWWRSELHQIVLLSTSATTRKNQFLLVAWINTRPRKKIKNKNTSIRCVCAFVRTVRFFFGFTWNGIHPPKDKIHKKKLAEKFMKFYSIFSENPTIWNHCTSNISTTTTQTHTKKTIDVKRILKIRIACVCVHVDTWTSFN